MQVTLFDAGFLRVCRHNIIFVGVEKPRDEYIARCESLKLEWHYVPRDSSASYLSFVLRLVRELRRIKPDFVFAHGLASVSALVVLKLTSWERVFVVLRETQAHHLKRFVDWFLLALASMFFDRIVYLTEDALSVASRKLGFLYSDDISQVIGNGLDVDYFSPVNSEVADGHIVIGMQSRLQANKDHRTLIMAFKILQTLQPNLALRLHIAGDGDTLVPLQHLVRDEALSECVFFHGMLDHSELRTFLGRLTLYVHCTHGETMSTAIMQALSCGLPVIASDVPGVSNMVGPPPRQNSCRPVMI